MVMPVRLLCNTSVKIRWLLSFVWLYPRGEELGSNVPFKQSQVLYRPATCHMRSVCIHIHIYFLMSSERFREIQNLNKNNINSAV